MLYVVRCPCGADFGAWLPALKKMRDAAFDLLHWHYHRYLESEEWGNKRADVLARDDEKCEHCGGYFYLHVHHLTYERVGAESLDDLLTLCRSCHEAVHQRVRLYCGSEWVPDY